jgi:O-antigen/teichoic acid export membrane protein
MVRFLSGATSQEEGKNIIGSGWVIGLIITLIIALILYIVYFLISKKLDESGFKLFFLWYPILSFIMMPYNYSICYLQAFRKFGPMIFLRIINMGSFVIFLIISYLFLSVEIWVVVIVHLACNGLASLSGIILGWSGLDSIRYAKKSWIKEQINFGKFSVGTLIGSNLLKSSDKIILGIMMKSADVAFYFIPLKLIEIIEIPVRSFVQVALPRMSKASRQNDENEVRRVFYSYAGILSILIIPLLIVLFFFAEFLVILLGGQDYAAAAGIFRIFLIYALFLPLDRFSGVTLDSINKPKYNLIKVIMMTLANIIGDIAVIYYFESLEAVALITVFNVLIGIIIGYYFLKREILISLFKIPVVGWKLIIKDGLKILKRIT